MISGGFTTLTWGENTLLAVDEVYFKRAIIVLSGMIVMSVLMGGFFQIYRGKIFC